jgi:putative DNA primase/helicase
MKDKEPTPLEIASVVYDQVRSQYLIFNIQETGEIALYRDGIFIRGFTGRKILSSIIYDRARDITKPLIPTEYMLKTTMKGFDNDWLISRDEFDIDENRITLLNGSYVYYAYNDSWVFKDHVAFDATPYKTFIQIPQYYDENAECPTIEKFLIDTFGLDNLELIYMMIGSIIFPTTKYQKSFVLHGVADSGKTTFISMLREFIGQKNCVEIPLQDLGKRFQRANCRDKLLNCYDDLSFHQKIKDLSVFKTLVTNPTLTGEIKNIQSHGNWRNFCTQLFTCNQLPPIPLHTGDDLWRRIILIECSNKVQKRDRNILDKITTREEFSGLLNKALAAYKKIIDGGGFPEEWDNPEYIEGIWNIDATPLKLFIEERCIFEGEVLKTEFRAELNEFRKNLNTYPLSMNKITRELEDLKVGKKRTRHGDVYDGISLKKEETRNITIDDPMLWDVSKGLDL